MDYHRGGLLWSLGFLDRSCTREGCSLILPITLPKLRIDQVDDLMSTIEEGEVVEEFRARNDVYQWEPPPPAAARTMPQRMARLEEDVHEIRRALAEQREVIGAMARDFSRFTIWAASSIA
ncbi:hypothetical protein Tco_1421043 [Tanacetum coccineum]